MKQARIVHQKGVLLFILLTIFTPFIYAADLMTVYRQALGSDPTFKKARSDWLSASQNFALARSGNGSKNSGLLPTIDVNGFYSEVHQRIRTNIASLSDDFPLANLSIIATQPIFNYKAWKALDRASYSVKAASATYIAAGQNLIFRTAQAYFNVLQAYDHLQFTRSQKKSFLSELTMAHQKFAVGVIPIAAYNEAKASYDSAKAQEITDQNNLLNRLEELRTITNKKYKTLNKLQKKLPLSIPEPKNINTWVETAKKHSYQLQSALNTMLAAWESIKEMNAIHYPTINAIAFSNVNLQGFPPSISGDIIVGRTGFIETTTSTSGIGVSIQFPVYQGGYINHATQQKTYDYYSSSHQLEITFRDLVKNTRESYLGINSGINKLRADQQAIISALSQLQSTKSGYQAGTRTMVDLLQAITTAYQAKQEWADDQYRYLVNVLSLKQQAGTLSWRDLKIINRWLTHPVTFDTTIPSTQPFLPITVKNPVLPAHLCQSQFISDEIYYRFCQLKKKKKKLTPQIKQASHTAQKQQKAHQASHTSHKIRAHKHNQASSSSIKKPSTQPHQHLPQLPTPAQTSQRTRTNSMHGIRSSFKSQRNRGSIPLTLPQPAPSHNSVASHH